MAERPITDAEIVEPGRLVFPNGFVIDVDSLYNGQVCYRAHPPDGGDARWIRKDIADFCRLVREHEGSRDG